MISNDIDRRNLSGPALRAFFKVSQIWELSNDQQMVLLGVSSNSTYFKWKKTQNGLLPKDTLERISYVLGIYKALLAHVKEPTKTTSWIRQPIEVTEFSGVPVLDKMLGGNVSDLYVVRRSLDRQLQLQ